MKKLFLILGFTLMLLAGCNKTNAAVAITTDRNIYTPAMSSAQGITMTPNFKSNKSYTELEYHWIADEGEFIGAGKEVKNHGEAVLWSAIEKNKVVEIKKSFKIKLVVLDSKSKKELANTSLTIIPDNGFYKVKQ